MKKNFDLMFFKPNRVWRCYKGGKLLNRLMGEESGEDSLFPENWLGSITLASNGEHQQSEIEGLSVLTDGELFFEIQHFHCIVSIILLSIFGVHRVPL